MSQSITDRDRQKGIGELCEIVDCEHKTAPYVEHSDYLVVRTSNVRSGTLWFEEIKFTTPEGYKEWTNRAMPSPSDIFFTREAPAGEACLVPDDLNVCMGQRMVLLSCDENLIESRYLLNWFLAEEGRRQIYRYSIGSTVTRINIEDIARLRVELPTLPEQRKIADFLTAVDGRIGQLIQKKALLEDYKNGVMQQIFTQAIRFKDDYGNDFSDWEEKKLGEIGSTYAGLSGKSGDDFGSGKPFVTYKQIFDRTTINLEKCGGVMIKPNERQNRVKKGDILFTTSSETRLEVGFTSVVMDDVDELYLNSFCFGFRMNGDDDLLPEFARYLFHSSHVRRSFAVLGQGSTRYNISKNQLMKQVFQFPSIPEQTKIADFLFAIDRMIESVATQITETQTFKRGLLQQMFV